MVMTPAEKYENYLRNNPAGERIVEVVEISHSAFSESSFICKEPGGLNVTLENGQQVFADGINMSIKRANSRDDLDEKYDFDFSDVNGTLQDKTNEIPLSTTEKVKIIYRVYMSDNLDSVALGPVRMEAINIAFKSGFASARAQSPSLVESRTGNLYTYERFPALKAFLS